MSERPSRHPWDPRGPLAPAGDKGAFTHLMTLLDTQVPIPQGAAMALCRSGVPRDLDRGARLVQWVAFIKGVAGASLLGLLWWISRPLLLLWFKGSLGAVALKSAIILGLGALAYRPIKRRWRARLKRRPTWALTSMDKVRAILIAHELRLSDAVFGLIASTSKAEEALLGLGRPEHRALREDIDALTLTRWDIVSELRAHESTLPDAVLEAFDKAAVPLMSLALDLAGGAPGGEEDARRALHTQSQELRAKVTRLLETQSARRERQSGADSAATQGAQRRIAEAMGRERGATFEEGMSELDALIESDLELGA